MIDRNKIIQNFLNEKIILFSNLHYDKQLNEYVELIKNIEIEKITINIASQIANNLDNLKAYTEFDLQAILFNHGDYIQNCGYSEVFAVRTGIDFSDDLIYADLTFKADFIENFSYIKAFDFSFSQDFSKFVKANIYDFHVNKKGLDVTKLLGFNDLCQLIHLKGYLGLHFALQKIIRLMNFSKGLPFVICEHGGGYSIVAYESE